MNQTISTSSSIFDDPFELLLHRLGFRIQTQQTKTPMYIISDLLKKQYIQSWTVPHNKFDFFDLLASETVDEQTIKCIIQTETIKKLYSDLNNLHKECEEEGLDPIDEKAIENAHIILEIVYTNFPNHEYHIYPTEDREVAIDCTPQKGRGVLILCDSMGGVAYFATLNGKNSRFRCDSIDDFPSEQLLQAFKTMQSDQTKRSYSDISCFCQKNTKNAKKRNFNGKTKTKGGAL